MQMYKWHGIPATGKTLSTERAGITWNHIKTCVNLTHTFAKATLQVKYFL